MVDLSSAHVFVNLIVKLTAGKGQSAVMAALWFGEGGGLLVVAVWSLRSYVTVVAALAKMEVVEQGVLSVEWVIRLGVNAGE